MYRSLLSLVAVSSSRAFCFPNPRVGCVSSSCSSSIMKHQRQQQQQQQQQQTWVVDGAAQDDVSALAGESQHKASQPSPPPSSSNTTATSSKPIPISSTNNNTSFAQKWKEWILKRAMDVTFWRESVRFFACGPYRYASLYYYDVRRHPHVKGYVALTLDDAPCRSGGRRKSYMSAVLDLLQRSNATATFMMVGDFMTSHSGDSDGDDHTPDLLRLVREGHEMGNHGMMDRPYHQDSTTEFTQAVDDCNAQIQRIYRLAEGGNTNKVVKQNEKKDSINNKNNQSTEDDEHAIDDDINHHRVRYFRAPHGKYTRAMETVLQQRGMINVMCDTYASCPLVTDGDYIGTSLAQKARDGSIILLHMPERGFREWTLVALQQLLEGLQQRGVQAVTVSRLQELAEQEIP
uniref:NodB homology domain-containing protein n=1 Tax=Amphora coffeiformis TaxID=265554 RepID=A0A7S3L2A9_9STRA